MLFALPALLAAVTPVAAPRTPAQDAAGGLASFTALLSRLFQPAAPPPAAAGGPAAPKGHGPDPLGTATHPDHTKSKDGHLADIPAGDTAVMPPPATPSIILTAMNDSASAQIAPSGPSGPVLMPAPKTTAVDPASATQKGAAKKGEAAKLPESHADLPVRPDHGITAASRVEPAGPSSSLETKHDTAPDVSALAAHDGSPAPVAASVARADSNPATPAVAHATPSQQIALAVSGLAKSADGTQSVTVQLRPMELGQVQIRIDQTPGGPARVDISAEKPETLQMLQRDQPRLMQALDLAGVQVDGRSINFVSAPPDQVSASASRPDSMAAGFGDSNRGQNGDPSRGTDDTAYGHHADGESGNGHARTRWFRAGLDITA